MATFTVTETFGGQTVFGNGRIVIGEASMTNGAGESFAVGLDKIGFAWATVKSATTDVNISLSFSTGNLLIGSSTSGDVYRVMCFGT